MRARGAGAAGECFPHSGLPERTIGLATIRSLRLRSADGRGVRLDFTPSNRWSDVGSARGSGHRGVGGIFVEVDDRAP